MTNHLRLDATVEGPRGWVACGWILMLVSHVFAPVFFNSPFFFLPRHADGMREGFDGGLSCHSAFFVSPPRHTGGTRQVFDGWFALL